MRRPAVWKPQKLSVSGPKLMRAPGLIATQLIGFAMLRYVWKIEPVASMTEAEVLSAIAPNIQRYIDGDLSTAQISEVGDSTVEPVS